MGANVKEFLRLVEDFVNLIGTQMRGFEDVYEVTENLGESPPPPSAVAHPGCTCECITLNPAVCHLDTRWQCTSPHTVTVLLLVKVPSWQSDPPVTFTVTHIW